MKIKNPFHFLYGLIMGTSVELLKPKRPTVPVTLKSISNDLYLLLGSDKNIGLYRINEKFFLINRETLKLQDSQLEALDKIANRNKIYSVRELEHGSVIITSLSGIFKSTQYMVDFKEEKVLFVDNLFFNKLHPLFSSLDIKDLDLWISTLEKKISTYEGYTIIPAEGEPGSAKDVYIFLKYLKDLNNSSIGYEELVKNYSDFQEIVGVTSLARNMDTIRGNPEWR